MPCTERNPLVREGTSQLNRVLAALNVHYADVYERDEVDLILFAKRYAEYLRYYNENNSPDGNWQPLMMMDVSVTLATLVSIDIKKINDYKKSCLKNIALVEDLPLYRRNREAKKHFKYLFDILISLIKIIDSQLVILPDGDYKKTIEEIIIRKLKLHLANLEEVFYRPFIAAGLLSFTVMESGSQAPIDVTSDPDFQRARLSGAWQSAVPDIKITIPVSGADYEKIIYCIHHNLFSKTIDSLLSGAAMITSRAKMLFDKTLTDFPQHTPHYGLYLAFIKLFKIARDELNHYTRRHLDFYYKEVLRLTNKKPLPDRAHLTFELQKTAIPVLLGKGILFKGGKDITGKEINYALADDIVVNRVKVAKLMAQQIDIGKHTPLKAFPSANSEDGQGGKLLSSDKSWFTFGDPVTEKTAKAGFAFASNILFLKEGYRTITVTITLEDAIPGINPKRYKRPSCFKAALTGKKDWLEKKVSTIYHRSERQLILSIELVPDDPEIIPYSEKTHGLNMVTGLPLLIIYLNQEAKDAIPYSVLCRKAVRSIAVDVRATGLRDLMLSNDSGSLDASKPFKPFGDFPALGAGFYIGSKEIFQKKISEISFDYTGDNISGSSVYYLSEGSWKSFPGISGGKISGINILPAKADFSGNETLKATTLNGFIKLGNNQSKSIDDYLEKVKDAINGTRLDLENSASLVYKLTVKKTPSPEEIRISSFTLGYKASASVDFTVKRSETENNLLFHVTPFGYAEVFNDGTPAIDQAEKTEKFALLADVVNNGELYVGLENSEPDTVVALLFQVAEGSSNPLKNQVIVNWFYLSENVWMKFENNSVIDRTNHFTRSGIVTITLPGEISDQNTLQGKGYRWIKAAVENDTDAVCRMILVSAQAAGVELLQDKTSGVEFRQTLPANSISKLVQGNASIKTISQPFPGFNGRLRESDDHFYIRVSERLRHKQRAVSISDYEHILLEKFPELYKVKCLNHTGFYKKNGDNVFCENLPGHITIIPVPDLQNNLHLNLLKPYTSVGLISDIEKYLKTLASPFVRLHVANPRFEEIQLEFMVKFHENSDVTYYTQLLSEEIEKFLCPWAFNSRAEIPFCSKIRKSMLLNFVEERPYVDIITCFAMHHFLREGETMIFENRNAEVAEATTSRSVLVSYYNEATGTRHLIGSPATCTC